MYRLFCNNKMLFSINFSEKLVNDSIDMEAMSKQLLENTIDRIRKWLDEGTENICLDDVNNDVLAASIKSIFRFAPAAGGVVLTKGGVVAIERNGIPDLPKGHIEKGERPDKAALREVREETAVSGLEIIRQLPSSNHCYMLDGQWVLKNTSWFLMKTDDEFKPTPQQEEGISRVYLLNRDNVEDFFDRTFVSLKDALKEEVLESLGL